jgi:phosphohistidine phosphatase SixA
MLYLVRHAKAGSRSNWLGDDSERPLSKNGRAQAAALADLLGQQVTARIVSSPSVRCVQTLQPLADRVGLTITTDRRLREGSRFDDVLELLASLPDGSALCSHGDVIPATIAALERRHCRIDGEPDWRKASTWVLEREDGDVVRATSWPPPSV